MPTSETRKFAHSLISQFRASEIAKLLALIDDSGISRGSLGQSVEAVISSVPNCDQLLIESAIDVAQDIKIREQAAFILGMHQGKGAIPTLDKLAHSGSKYAAEISAFLRETGYLNPYS